MNDARTEASRNWFGYGSWSAPYWFVGMEPGGADHPDLYTSWEACGSGSLIDAAQHEDEWNKLVPADLQMHHFDTKTVIQRGTWQPLIHIVLGFTGSNEDSHIYQRDKLGRAGGKTALIELSSVASTTLSSQDVERPYEAERIIDIRQHLEHEKPGPAFVVFYGTTYTRQYSEVAGGQFDEDGFRWNGTTLCALIKHPARPTRSYQYWRDYGEKLRDLVDAKRAR